VTAGTDCQIPGYNVRKTPQDGEYEWFVSGTIANGTYVLSAQATASSGCSGVRLAQPPVSERLTETKVFNGKIYPNPTDGPVQIELKLVVAKLVTVKVVNQFGTVVSRTSRALGKRNNRVSLNIGALPPGLYVIEVRDGSAVLDKYKILKI